MITLLLALYGLTVPRLRDDALVVLLGLPPLWARRIGGQRGPYARLARYARRRWETAGGEQ